MSEIKDSNYFTVQGWMYRLGLDNLSEIAAYAIIYGFSQDEESDYKGSFSYMQNFLKCCKNTSIKVLTSLEEKGLIVKYQQDMAGIKVNRYKAVVPDCFLGSKNELVSANFLPTGANNLPPSSNSELLSAENELPSANSAPKNIKDIYSSNKKDIKIINKPLERNKKDELERLFKKKKKELDLSFVSILYEDVFDEWIKYRVEIRSKFTQSIAESNYRTLLTLSNNDPRTAQQIVQQSKDRGWTGLFELKQNQYGNNINSQTGQPMRNVDRRRAELDAYLDSFRS